jgi:hypothetical protein
MTQPTSAWSSLLAHHLAVATSSYATQQELQAHQEALRLADHVGQAVTLAVWPADEPDVAAQAFEHAQPQVELFGGVLQPERCSFCVQDNSHPLLIGISQTFLTRPTSPSNGGRLSKWRFCSTWMGRSR